MKIVSGKFNGTGAALYLCFGFVPDRIELRNIEDGDGAWMLWTREMMQAADCVQGIRYVATGGATQQSLLTTTGIEPHFGGTVLTSTNQTSVTYGDGVYLGWDNFDYRRVNNTDTGIVGDAATDDIVSWTLDTPASYTGHFNGNVTGTYIAEGSPIIIDGKRYSITALSAGTGSAANAVTLNQAAPSGVVQFIGGCFGTKPIAVGKTTPAGIKLNATDVINVNNELCLFEAVQYDN